MSCDTRQQTQLRPAPGKTDDIKPDRPREIAGPDDGGGTAVVLNVAVVNPEARGYVTVFTRPSATPDHRYLLPWYHVAGRHHHPLPLAPVAAWTALTRLFLAVPAIT